MTAAFWVPETPSMTATSLIDSEAGTHRPSSASTASRETADRRQDASRQVVCAGARGRQGFSESNRLRIHMGISHEVSRVKVQGVAIVELDQPPIRAGAERRTLSWSCQAGTPILLFGPRWARNTMRAVSLRDPRLLLREPCLRPHSNG